MIKNNNFIIMVKVKRKKSKKINRVSTMLTNKTMGIFLDKLEGFSYGSMSEFLNEKIRNFINFEVKELEVKKEVFKEDWSKMI